jgi:hypothetical protein
LTLSDVSSAVSFDPNIYRAADLLIWCHGTNANIEAARIADAMRGFGDRDEHAFWITVGEAIIELEAPSRQSQPRPFAAILFELE